MRTLALGPRGEAVVSALTHDQVRVPRNRGVWPDWGVRSTEKNQGHMESQGHRVRKVEWVFILCGIASIQFFCFLWCFRSDFGLIGPQISPSMTLPSPFPTPYGQRLIVGWPQKTLKKFHSVRRRNNKVLGSFDLHFQVLQFLVNLSKKCWNFRSYQPIPVSFYNKPYIDPQNERDEDLELFGTRCKSSMHIPWPKNSWFLSDPGLCNRKSAFRPLVWKMDIRKSFYVLGRCYPWKVYREEG